MVHAAPSQSKAGSQAKKTKRPTTINPEEALEDDSMLGSVAAPEEKPVPYQLGLTIEVVNTGEEEFEFQAAAFADLAVKDLVYHAQGVRALGLNDRYVIDYSEGAPQLLKETMSFVYPQTPIGSKMDRVYVGTYDTDVLFCPGDLQYYELVFHSGFEDTVLAHPDLGDDNEARHYVTLGGGKVGAPVKLDPDAIWTADFGIRKHPYYWPRPWFEVNGTPLPENLREQVDLPAT